MVYFHAQLQPGDPFSPSIGAGARVQVTLKGTSNAAIGSSMPYYNSTAQPLPSNFTVVPEKSSQTRVLFDPDGLPKITEEQIYTSSLSWTVVRQDWSYYVNAVWPSSTLRRTGATEPKWQVANRTWTSGRLTESANEIGITQRLSYDSVGRIVKVTRDAVSAIGAAIAEQSVEMSYDPVGRLLRRWKTSGGR
jgi:YD repeat-containing protein